MYNTVQKTEVKYDVLIKEKKIILRGIIKWVKRLESENLGNRRSKVKFSRY